MKRNTSTFTIVALVGVALGAWLTDRSAQAFTCGNGTCLCGDADINPANGLPRLPWSLWQSDCDDLADACGRLGGTFTCSSWCAVDVCCGASCEYD